jgi:hypothetical protein
MNIQRPLLSAILGVIALVSLTLFAQSREDSPTRQMMRQKLDHAQSVLEGITMSDFALIRNHAARLGALSQEAGWRAYDTPEPHSKAFFSEDRSTRCSRQAKKKTWMQQHSPTRK